MVQTPVPSVEEVWRRIATPEASSLMTPLGLVEGEVLTYLEKHGATPMRRLIRELEWSAPLVMMALGALVRGGFARAVQHDLEVVAEALEETKRASPTDRHEPPKALGG